jgi:hypothetical protein
MARLLMTVFGGLLCGIAAWSVVGFIAAQIGMRSGSSPDGGAAMSGFFFIGGIGGFLGAVAGAIAIWRALGEPARIGSVGAPLLGLLAVEIIAVIVVMMPKHDVPNDFAPGKRGEMQVEVKFPAAQVEMLNKSAVIYELRAAGATAETPWQPSQLRHEGDRAIVPGAFRVQEVRTWILAVMNGERQLASTTVGIDQQVDKLEATTEWSAWQPVESGLEARWRFAVLAQ